MLHVLQLTVAQWQLGCNQLMLLLLLLVVLQLVMLWLQLLLKLLLLLVQHHDVAVGQLEVLIVAAADTRHVADIFF